MKKVKSFSHTKVRTYGGCPLQFKGIYIDGNTVVSVNPNMAFGAVGHAVFSRYLNHLKKEGLQTDITAIQEIAEATFKDKTIRKENPLPMERLGELIEVSERFADVTVIGPDFRGSEIPFALKRDLTPCDYDDPEAFFRGWIDRLDIKDGEAEITDYKTSWHAAYDELQGENYTLAVFKLFPDVTSCLPIFKFPRPNMEKKRKAGAYIREDDLEQLEKRVLGRISIIEADEDFLPTPGSACADCQLECPAVLSNLKAVTNEEEAIKMATDILLLNKKRKDATEALQAWANKSGPVTVNDQVLAYHPTESLKFPDIQSFIDACKDFDRDPNSFLKIDSTKAKKLLKDKDEGIREAFWLLAVTEQGQKWGIKKAKKS